MKIGRFLAGIATAALVATGTAALDDAAAKQPAGARVSWSSLRQTGQSFTWRFGLTGALDTYRFGLSGRHQLCLRVAQGDHTARSHQLCVVGPGGNSRKLQLVWAFSAPGGLKVRKTLEATFTKVNSRSWEIAFLPSAVKFAYRPVHWQAMTTINESGSVILFPAKPVQLRLRTPQVVGCAPTGPKFVFSARTNVKEVALTFDDGPSPEPPAIDFVRRLHQLHAVGTFFEIGDQISTYDPGGRAEKLMLRYGDMIGDHTWTHPDMTGLSPAAQRSEILRTATAIRSATGFTPCLFRAPYGSTDPELLDLVRKLGMTTIQWNVDTQDWKLPGTAAIVAAAVNGAAPGAIILQHFGGGPRYETYDALPQEIQRLRARGYRFVTVTQLLHYKLLYKQSEPTKFPAGRGL